MIKRLAAFVVAALMVCVLADAAAGGQPTQTPSGSGVIAGRVELTEHDQRAPLRRATVTLSNLSGKSTTTTATDHDGTYRFAAITSGSYRVSVEKAGFLCAVTAPVTGDEASSVVAVAGGSTHVVNFTAQRAAALEGRLVEDTGKPIAGRSVTAERLDEMAGQPAVLESYSAKTDDLGRFRVHTIQPGRYRITTTPSAAASGARLYYPGTEKVEDAGILTVASGQTLDGLVLAVATASLPAITAEAIATQELEALNAPTRGGSWSSVIGRVTRADTGLPVFNAAVKLSTTAGALLLTAWTDGDGGYSFGRVMAGAYLLVVSADGFTNPDATLSKPGGGTRITVADGERLKKEIALTPLSSIEGRVLDEFGDPAPGVFLRLALRTTVVDAPGSPVAPVMNAVTDDRGWFRVSRLMAGDYDLIAVPEPFAQSGPAAFPITYYPGTSSAAAALPIQMMAGVDAHGVNLALPAANTTVISGTVTDSAGRRVNTMVTLSPIFDGVSIRMFRAYANTDANGNFVYRHVPEGTYLVESMGPLGRASRTVATPIQPFVIALKPFATARGRVTFDDAPPQAPSAARPSEGFSARVSEIRFQSMGPPPAPGFPTESGGLVRPDWTFQISGLWSSGVLRVSGFPGWRLARVLLQGRDITDVPYDFQSDVDGLEVVLTKRVGGITGTVQGVAQAEGPVSVVVFGADGDSSLYLSRTLSSAQASESGAFTLRELLPGRYLAVAVRLATPRPSLEALQKLRSSATPVVVTEGADTAITLSIVK